MSRLVRFLDARNRCTSTTDDQTSNLTRADKLTFLFNDVVVNDSGGGGGGGGANGRPPFAWSIGKPDWSAVFQNYDNSCYLDSLLVILLLGETDFYRNAFFTTDLSQASFLGAKKVIAVCSAKSATQSESDIRAWAQRLQQSMWTDFEKLTTLRTGSEVTCSNTRNTLADCLTKMKVDGRWAQEAPNEVYKVLADAFPVLNISFKEHIYRVDGGWSAEKVQPAVPMYMMQDFVGDAQLEYNRSPISQPPLKDGEKMFRSPQWDTMTYAVIVFLNGVLPTVLRWNELRTENEGLQTMKKVSTFDEYIIDRRYRLFGVTRHHGGKPGMEASDGHYTAYMRRGDAWYAYNDLRGIERTPNGALPNDAFVQERGVQPHMFFYERVDPN
jgi:hypothetical protein